MSSDKDKRNNIPGQEKEFFIIVNGRSNVVVDKKISYEDVIKISGIQDSGANSLQLITFERGEHGKAEGTLSQGDQVSVHEGMVFNVSSTNKS